uniref:Sigma-54-dependent Fis family transcriptional regulator n=1 Tax=Desulfobacca acetoxidans TaxID=60893 RepID=A0A7C3Z8L4_9BACT
MKQKAILVIDAQHSWEEARLRLAKIFQVELARAVSADEAKGKLREHYFLAVMLAEDLPGHDSRSFLAEVKAEHPFLPVYLVSRRPTVEGAVAAMREGAQDYLAAPLSWEKLSAVLEPYLKNGRPATAGNIQKDRNASPALERPVITQDPAMLHILRMAKSVAPTRATVLIQGESGTGKEILARYLHAHSDRAGNPFVAVNCAALPEGLLESELFGHEKGAFTGALVRKLGKFELAHNGTLLLDEISEMHPHLQAKLLRVLQENEIDRVGGRHPIPINVRVIATTNQDIQELIQKNDFREDLFYRLQVISFTLPPLRDRRGDIPLLAEYFLQRYAQLFNKKNVSLAPAALAALERASWPGNIRQLENTIARGVLLAEGNHVHPRDLRTDNLTAAPDRVSLSPPSGDKPVTLREMEQQLIYQALDETSGNRTHAAKLLGISVRTLRNKLHEYRQTVRPAPASRSQVA